MKKIVLPMVFLVSLFLGISLGTGMEICMLSPQVMNETTGMISANTDKPAVCDMAIDLQPFDQMAATGSYHHGSFRLSELGVGKGYHVITVVARNIVNPMDSAKAVMNVTLT